MKYALFFLFFGVSLFTNAEEQRTFQEGKDYFAYSQPILLDPQVEQNSTTDEPPVQILFFFDYDCRNCINVQDFFALYQQLGDNIIVEEYPVAVDGSEFSAKVYYSLQRMNHSDIADLLLFETADVQNYRRFSQFPQLLKWLETQKIDTALFTDIYNSQDIAMKVKQAKMRTERFGVFTFPFVVIDGRFVLTNSTLYNDDYSFAVLDFLVKKIRTSNQPLEKLNMIGE